MTENEAKDCLDDILTKTTMALRELHSLGLAHLDVRLPNICFAINNSEIITKLIDLAKMNTVGNYHGEMYKAPIDAPSQHDWKQLGLLASEVIIGTHNHCKIMKDDRVIKDDWKLIVSCRCSGVETDSQISEVV